MSISTWVGSFMALGPPPVLVWILALGIWNDSGVWVDSDVWID